MIFRLVLTFLMILAIVPISLNAQNLDLKKAMFEEMKNKKRVCVFIEDVSDETITTDSILVKERKTPCSTFKIWNTVIGLETGNVSSSDELFYLKQNYYKALAGGLRFLI